MSETTSNNVTELFPQVPERTISGAIVRNFARQMEEALNADVFIIGAGPAGLTAGRLLADAGVNTFIIERNNYLGGGYWLGGYFMNTVTVRAPAQRHWDEVGAAYEQMAENLYATSGALACSSLIAAAAKAGVKFMQLTHLDDLMLNEAGQRVSGVVVNWSPVKGLPKAITCVDPIALESKLVIDATGHDAVAVSRLARRGLVEMKGMGTLNVHASEAAIVEHTCEVFPGLIVAGMAVSETFGLSRMGPTFGGMLLSGERAAELALEKLRAKAAAE